MQNKNAPDNPTDALKIYELSLIWKEAAYNFAFWESLMPLSDWDKAYRDALPAVLATQNLYDYYLELMKFVALLRDGHTDVKMPQSIEENPAYASGLPIFMTYSNGEYVVSDIKRVAGEKVKQWSVVKKINGQDVYEYVAQHVFPYVWHEKLDSASWLVSCFISDGPLGSKMDFELEHGGEISTVTLERTKGDADWLQ